MPTLFTMLLASTALIGIPFTFLRNSRRAAYWVDLILFASLVAARLPPFSQSSPFGPLDIVRVILILSFHEFSSIYSDATGFELGYAANGPESSVESNLGVHAALVHRTLLVSGILLLAVLVSEAYFFGAEGTSASLYSIYGIAGGLMAVIITLFLLLTLALKKPEK